MMREHENDDGYGRQVRRYDERDDGRGRDDRDVERRRGARSSRYEDEHVPFSSRRHDEDSERQTQGNSVASVWEITAQSRHSFEDAIQFGIDRARRNLRHVRGAWVQGQEVLLRNGEIYAYRVQLKLTIVLDEGR